MIFINPANMCKPAFMSWLVWCLITRMLAKH